ncbi:MAG TPA: hypothetical protein VEU74_12090 [Gemmatimonadales bacterium]|nr:hypothetical protein [Gemmatimonadales bacterium]
MAVQVGTVVTQARNRHPAFHRRNVSDALALSFLSDRQAELLTRAAELDRNRVAIRCSIAFAVTPGGNAPGQVGAGSGGGLPAKQIIPPPLGGPALFTPGEDTGPGVELDLDHAQVLVPDTVIAVADANSVTVAGAPTWILNQFANQVAVVVAGTGYGQRRLVLSNTTTGKLVISTGTDGEQWATIPDTTSLIRVVQATFIADDSVSFVTELPPKRTDYSYLVKIDPQGRPFLDIANPITVVVDAGIPLPPFHTLIGGSVRLTGTQGLDPLTAPLTLRNYADRYHWGPTYTAWLENDQLFLSGTLSDWSNAIAIDLRMVPVPPDFVALTDYLLLPDVARPALIAGLAEFMAGRVAATPDTPPIDKMDFATKRTESETTFLTAFGSNVRAFAKYVHEVW